MSEIVVPKWGLTVEEVTILEWYKKPGDPVAADEPVCLVETDKVTQEIVSQVDGTVLELLAEDGDEVPIGQPIAKLGP
ncbi:biotin attachment protein [Amycolatopsis sp. AA4]|uniref:lipoyl domain-containing protein n=1 Tax=Actinomycetes TaxID=1760 RepID=UPI0001B56AA9|nr:MULTISPECIES: lipoyl domain-containing protein [Actinomycetes]ATY11255.1 biotin attachment protein [Amycolatopsis sp. AA4]